MEEQDRSAIADHHPHQELAQDRHAKGPAMAPTDQQAPGVENAMRPNRFRFEDDTGLPGFGLEVHDRPDPTR